MTQEQQIIQQIQQRLSAAHLERNENLEDLAAQYAELCEAVIDRLSRCLDYLDRGMRSEAVNEALTEPGLVAMIDLLRFEGVSKWYNLCVDVELTVPPEIDMEAYKRLKEAIDTELSMEPLMREYRRSVYMGDHELSIQLLRKIREKDPSNPSWAINLKPLEEGQIPSLVQRTEEALRSDNMKELRILYAEFTHPQRAAEPPAEIMRKLKTALLSERASDLNREAGNLIRKLHLAIEAEKVTEVEALLESADRISADEAFIDVPGSWNSVLSKAGEMLDMNRRHEEKRAAFLKEVDSLQEKLSAGSVDEITLRHAWEHVQSWGIPVSDILARQVNETLDEMNRARRRRLRIVKISVFSAILLIAAVSCIWFALTMRSSRRNACSAHVQKLFDEGKYERLVLYVDELRRTDPEFAASPQIVDLLGKAQAGVRRLEQMTANYDSIMDELESVRRRGYKSVMPERISQLLSDAMTFANELRDNVRQNRVKAWRTSYEEWNDRRVRDASSEVSQFVSSVQSAMNEAGTRPFADSSEEMLKISELNSRKEEALQYLSNVDEHDRKLFTEQAERLQAWEREVQERIKARKNTELELSRLRDDIPAALPDLVRYRSLMQRYVEIAPRGDERVPGYKRLLANFNLYLSLPSLNTFTLSQLPPNEEECGKIEMLLSGVAKGTIWEKSLNLMLDLSRARGAMENEVLAMSGDTPALTNFYYIEYRPKGEKSWRRLYSPRMPVIAPDLEKPGVVRVFGKIYHAFNPDDNVVETHTNEVFGKDFNTENYDFRYERKKEDNVSEYYKFLESFSIGAGDSDDMVVYLLDELARLKVNGKMEPVLKATAFKRIANMLNKNYGVIVPEFRTLAELLDTVDISVPWMNRNNPRVAAEEMKFGKILDLLPDFNQLKNDYKERCKECLNMVNSRYSCVGSLVVKDGFMEVNLVSNVNGPFESIVSLPLPKMIIVSHDGKSIAPDAKGLVINGMPLFIKR